MKGAKHRRPSTEIRENQSTSLGTTERQAESFPWALLTPNANASVLSGDGRKLEYARTAGRKPHHALPHCAGCCSCPGVFLLTLCWTFRLVASIAAAPGISDKWSDAGDFGSEERCVGTLNFGYNQRSLGTRVTGATRNSCRDMSLPQIQLQLSRQRAGLGRFLVPIPVATPKSKAGIATASP